jgi:type II secretory pathway pseudopilin PulG
MNRTPTNSVTPSLRHSVTSKLAFTVTELLVVIALIVILILIAVPSFKSMVDSSEEAMAESQLRAALRAARDAAVRSNGDGDGAAVFFFEPGGRTSILPCVKVGEISDWSTKAAADGQDNNTTTRREIFAAAPGFTAITLPKYWNARGFAPVHSITDEWYGQGGGTPTVPVNNNTRAWVFPETGFYKIDQPGAATDGYKRSTFMVRFHAGSGELVGASTSPALVFALRNSAVDRTGAPYSDVRYRADKWTEDPGRFVRQILGKVGGPQNMVEKRQLIGRLSSDMVLARPVMQVAIYNERVMARAFGVNLDRATDSVYQDPANTNYTPALTGTVNINAISQYIEGDEDLNGTVNSEDRPWSRIYSIDRYSGAVRRVEVQP